MNMNRKQYEPLDAAAMDVIDELRAGASGREVARLSGLSHNRTAILLRRDTPPPTMSEIEALASAFGKSASWVAAEAESRLGAGAPVVPLFNRDPLSDPAESLPVAASDPGRERGPSGEDFETESAD